MKLLFIAFTAAIGLFVAGPALAHDHPQDDGIVHETIDALIGRGEHDHDDYDNDRGDRYDHGDHGRGDRYDNGEHDGHRRDHGDHERDH